MFKAGASDGTSLGTDLDPKSDKVRAVFDVDRAIGIAVDKHLSEIRRKVEKRLAKSV